MPASRLEPACAPNAAAAPLSLYIHWPFCVSKCPYCDFNSHIAGELDEAAWLRSMCAELEHMSRIAAETLSTDNLRLETIFFVVEGMLSGHVRQGQLQSSFRSANK